MTMFRAAVLSTALVAVNFPALGETPPPAKRKATSSKTARDFTLFAPKALQEALAINRTNILFLGPQLECEVGGAPCEVPVELTELFDSAGKLAACIVRSRDIKLTYGANPKGKYIEITWNLVVPTGVQAQYEFEPEKGILILQNNNKSTGNKGDKVTKPQVKLKHSWKIKGDEIYYYPLVLQSGAGVPVLCAAADPKMIND